VCGGGGGGWGGGVFLFLCGGGVCWGWRGGGGGVYFDCVGFGGGGVGGCCVFFCIFLGGCCVGVLEDLTNLRNIRRSEPKGGPSSEKPPPCSPDSTWDSNQKKGGGELLRKKIGKEKKLSPSWKSFTFDLILKSHHESEFEKNSWTLEGSSTDQTSTKGKGSQPSWRNREPPQPKGRANKRVREEGQEGFGADYEKRICGVILPL